MFLPHYNLGDCNQLSKSTLGNDPQCSHHKRLKSDLEIENWRIPLSFVARCPIVNVSANVNAWNVNCGVDVNFFLARIVIDRRECLHKKTSLRRNGGVWGNITLIVQYICLAPVLMQPKCHLRKRMKKRMRVAVMWEKKKNEGLIHGASSLPLPQVVVCFHVNEFIQYATK